MAYKQSIRVFTKRLLCMFSGFVFFAYVSMVFSAEIISDSKRAEITQKAHGSGKKEMSCDMKKLNIIYNGKTTVKEAKEFIALPAVGNVEEGDRRANKKGLPVLPVANLFKDYPDADLIETTDCNSDKHYSITKQEVDKNHKTYILTFSRVGRVRLAKYEQIGPNRGKYQTVAQNVVTIKLTK